MAAASAIAVAKSMMGKQLCQYGGYRSQCPAKVNCLHRHYDDTKEPVKSYSTRNRTNENSNNQNSDVNKEQKKHITDICNRLEFDVPRYCNVQRDNRLNALCPVNGHDFDDFHRTGLKNVGNTCYLNAIIQSLVHTDSLITKLMKMGRQKNLNEGFSSELALLAMVLKSGEYRRLTPVNFRAQLIKVNNIFNGYQQHDAHEALTCILSNMESELQATENWKELMKDTFRTEITTKRRCTQCNDQSQSVEPLPVLQIQIPKEKTCIQECLKEYMEPETLKDKRCLKCNKSMESEVTTKFTKIPDVLVIQLKRFSKEGRWLTKNRTHIQPSLTIKIEKEPENIDVEYELFSMINHRGGLTAGHYTTVCYDEIKERWILYDDEDSEIWEEERINQNGNAYIFFYRRKNEPATTSRRSDAEPLILSQEGDWENTIYVDDHQQRKQEEEKDENDTLNRGQAELKKGGTDDKKREGEGTSCRPRRRKPSAKVVENHEQEKTKKTAKQETKKLVAETVAEDGEKVVTKKQNSEQNKEAVKKKMNQTTCPVQNRQEKCNKCEGKRVGYQIACDDCGEWFHGKCVGVEDGKYGPNDAFKCYPCWVKTVETLKKDLHAANKETKEIKSKYESMQKDKVKSEKLQSRVNNLEDDVTKKKNEMKVLRIEKERMKQVDIEKSKKVKDQEVKITKK